MRIETTLLSSKTQKAILKNINFTSHFWTVFKSVDVKLLSIMANSTNTSIKGKQETICSQMLAKM